MLDEQTKQQLESYARGELSPDEHSKFTQILEQNPQLQELLLAEKLIQRTLAPSPIEKAKQIVETLGEDLFLDEEENISTAHRQANDGYTLNELLSMFGSVAHLEAELVGRSTSTGNPESLEELVLLPENNVDCPDNVLYFAFAQTTPITITISIINSQEEEIALPNNCIEANLSNFTLALPTNLPPGKYYWQLHPQTANRSLRRKYGIATGNFYINGGLNPHK